MPHSGHDDQLRAWVAGAPPRRTRAAGPPPRPHRPARPATDSRRRQPGEIETRSTGGAIMISRDASPLAAPAAGPRRRRTRIPRAPAAGRASAARRGCDAPRHPRFHRALVECSGAAAHAAKIEAQRRDAGVLQGARQGRDHLVVHGAAEQADADGKAARSAWPASARIFDDRLQRPGRAVEWTGARASRAAGHSMPTSSTSKTSVAPGGMTPPAPLSP